MRTGTLLRLAAAGLAALALSLPACGDRGSTPTGLMSQGGGRGSASAGLAARITAQPPEADSGATVLLRAKLRAGGRSPLRPTAFRAAIRYDTAALEVLEAVDPEGTTGPAIRVTRLVPGRAMGAAAAPDGFKSATMFAVRARVRSAGWRETLELELDEAFVAGDSLDAVTGLVGVARGVISEEAYRASMGDGGRGGGRTGGRRGGGRRRFPGGGR